MLPIVIEVPAGTPVRVVPQGDAGEMTKTAAYMEKTAGDDRVTLKKGQAVKLFETREEDGRQFRSDLVILRGV